MKKIVISWLICVLGLLALLVWLGYGSALVKNDLGQEDPSLITGKYSLQSATGPVSQKNFKGKYTLIYFGFTHCPDICPTTLLLMQNAIRKQEPSVATQIQPIFITVDPERDTPKVVATYVKNFGKNIVGLSGTPEQIKAAADNFKVYYSKVPMDDEDPEMGYMMNHSGFLFLMGPDGQYITHFASNVPEAELISGLRKNVR